MTIYRTAKQDYLTPHALADRYGVSAMTVYRLVDMGAFPNAIRVIRSIRIPISDVRDYERDNRIVVDEYADDHESGVA